MAGAALPAPPDPPDPPEPVKWSIVPVCAFCHRQPVDPKWRPFCSDRCRLQDLARWAEGSYRVAGEPAPTPEEIEHSKLNTKED